MSMAIGTGMLAGATAITVLATSSPAAAKTQTANCTFNGVGNQLQGSPTVLVPFMINGGAAIIPGTTTVNIKCAGLPINTTMVVGVASPLAGFNSTTFTPTNALNEFMGSYSSTGPDEPVSSETGTLTIAETVNADQQALDTDAVCPPSAAQVALGLSNCAMAVADLAGNEYGFAYVNYPSSTSYPVTPWPGAYAVPTAEGTGYAMPPTLSVLNVTDTAAFTYGTALTTNAAASAGDEVVSGVTGANCGFNQLTACTALPVPALGSAIAQGTVLLVGSLSGTHEIVVTTAPAAVSATMIWVNNLVNTYPSSTTVTPITGGSSAATAGNQVFLSGNGYWADPDGTLTEPLTIEVTDSLGTANELTTNTQNPEAIGVDIYTATHHGGGSTGGSGGTFTGATLGILETIPAGGLGYGAGGPGTGSPAAFVGGSLTYAVVEPSVAPFNDVVSQTTTTTTGPVAYSYDTATDPCTTAGTNNDSVSYIGTDGGTVCGIPGPTATGGNGTNPAPLGAIGVDVASYISPAALAVSTTSLPAGTVSSAYSATLVATGGTTPYTWALTSGTLPSWATLNGTTGAITGTPTAAATTSGLEFTATDSSTPTHETATSVSLSIVISLAPFSVTTTSLNGGTVGSSYSTTLVATGGTTPYTWALTSGTLPSWATLNGTTGAITGTPTAAATTSGLEFTATDSSTPTHETATSVSLSIVISLAGSPGGGTPPTVPGAPTALNATAGNTQVALSWTTPSSDGGSAITGYDVYEGTSAGAEGTTAVNTSFLSGTSYAVTGLTNGTKYFFTVEAVNAVGNSPASNEASATPVAPTTPPPSPSSNPCASYTGNSAFLCSAYEDLLGRAPDSAGLAYWNALLTGGTSRSAVAYDIATSPEYRGDLVSSYYEAFLGRTSDPGGLSYWVAQLAGGATDQTVAAGFLGSNEFYTDSGGTPAGFVTALYAKLLGRAPDSGGLAYWESQLSSGTTQSAVAAGILSSTEYRSDFVEAQYAYLLGRAADAGGLSYWVAQLAGGASNESVISGIVGSAEFYTDATT
jgi:hypothetical protein